MVVGDEALPKSFVEARHRLGDQDGTKPEQNILGFFYLMRTFYGFFGLGEKRILRKNNGLFNWVIKVF